MVSLVLLNKIQLVISEPAFMYSMENIPLRLINILFNFKKSSF